MRKLSLLMLMLLVIGMTFGCGNATQSNGNSSAKSVNIELPDDVKARLANYELTKSRLSMLEQEKETYKELYMNSTSTKVDNGNIEVQPVDTKEIEDLKNQLNAKENELSALNTELMNKKGEASSLTEKITEIQAELNKTKNQLNEALKNSNVTPLDMTAIDEAILLKLVEYAKTKTRGDYLTAKINEFLASNPDKKSKFDEALKTLAELTITVPTYNADAVTTFTDLGKLTGTDLMKCPSADELPGIIYEIIANKIKTARSADVALVIDTTSTMGDELDSLKRILTVLYPQLTKICKDLRFSFVTFRDLKTKFGDPGYISQVDLDFSRTIRDIVLGVRKISLETGGNYDIPEAVYEGVMTSLKDTSWSSRAEQRMILLIGDAPAGIGEKFFMHKRRGKTLLEATHTVTLENVKTQLDSMKTEMMTEDAPLEIYPIVCAEEK